jgi:hypothetical protein
MTDGPERPRGHHDGWGAAAVYLVVLALFLGVGGGLMLVAMVIAPPLGPENEMSDAVWAVPIALSVSGIVVALVGRSALLQIALAVFGALFIVGSAMAILQSARSVPARGLEMALSALPLLLGLLALGLSWRDRRLGHGDRAAVPTVSC